MKGRHLGWLLAALLVVALALQVERAARRWRASVILRRAETVAMAAAASGRAPRALLSQNLRDLRRAGRLDPGEASIPLTLGSTYLLMDSPQAAARAYREALAVEPRPEIYLNLGRALWLAGEPREARRSFRRAVLLDRRLKAHVPPFPDEPAAEPDS